MLSCKILHQFSCPFFLFSAFCTKTLKKHISTSVCTGQHQNGGRNIQQSIQWIFTQFGTKTCIYGWIKKYINDKFCIGGREAKGLNSKARKNLKNNAKLPWLYRLIHTSRYQKYDLLNTFFLQEAEVLCLVSKVDTVSYVESILLGGLFGFVLDLIPGSCHGHPIILAFRKFQQKMNLSTEILLFRKEPPKHKVWW